MDSAEQIICRSCGTAWDRDDGTVRYYFRSTDAGLAFDSASPALISDSGQDMDYCPSCQDAIAGPLLDDHKIIASGITESPLYRGDSLKRRFGSVADEEDERAPAPRTDADVTHGE